MIFFWGLYAWVNNKFIFFLRILNIFFNIVFLTQNIIVEISQANYMSNFVYNMFHTRGSIESKFIDYSELSFLGIWCTFFIFSI